MPDGLDICPGLPDGDIDGDGEDCTTDCDDADPLNFNGNTEDCSDGQDNDCNLDIDCADISCSLDPVCACNLDGILDATDPAAAARACRDALRGAGSRPGM